MTQSGVPARRAAVALLDKVLGEGRLLSELVGGGALAALDPADRARAQRLAADTLRGLARADRVLKPHLRKAPPLTVRNVLRLATVELCGGSAAHGVVNDAVTLVGENRRTVRMKGLVNAVLRKVAATGPDAWSTLPVPRLPNWLRAPLVAAWGKRAVAAMEAAHARGAPLDLTARSDPAPVASSVKGELLPTGSVRLSTAGQISSLPGYAGGEWWVQDAAAALPVVVLDPRPGEHVLDLCAAPGGKTLQAAARGAHVTAVDSSDERLARLRDNLARTGLNAEIRAADVRAITGRFDAVLLDAPCSATGTIRRHPDLPHAKDGTGISELIALQADLLDHAVTLVKPGGRLVFCTCSLLPDEGECQIESLLTRHAGLKVDTNARNRPGFDPAWHSAEGGLRLRPDFWPERGGIDGFYMCALRKLA